MAAKSEPTLPNPHLYPLNKVRPCIHYKDYYSLSISLVPLIESAAYLETKVIAAFNIAKLVSTTLLVYQYSCI